MQSRFDAWRTPGGGHGLRDPPSFQSLLLAQRSSPSDTRRSRAASVSKKSSTESSLAGAGHEKSPALQFERQSVIASTRHSGWPRRCACNDSNLLDMYSGAKRSAETSFSQKPPTRKRDGRSVLLDRSPKIFPSSGHTPPEVPSRR
jgi:hypothetical protein